MLDWRSKMEFEEEDAQLVECFCSDMDKAFRQSGVCLGKRS